MIARHLNFALLALLIAVAPVRAGACALVAVASNFAPTAQALARAWAGQGGCMPRFSAASTGQLYAQALAGAPFDLLLAADVERPAALAERLGLPAPLIYALGLLAAVTAQSAESVEQPLHSAIASRN